jgi:hypothetical protein
MSDRNTFDPEPLDDDITVGEYFSQVKLVRTMDDAQFVVWVEGYLSKLPVKSMAFIAQNELLKRFRRKI